MLSALPCCYVSLSSGPRPTSLRRCVVRVFDVEVQTKPSHKDLYEDGYEKPFLYVPVSPCESSFTDAGASLIA